MRKIHLLIVPKKGKSDSMVVETAKEQISMNQIIGTRKDIFQIENDIIVNDIKPDVLSIINTNGIICVNKKEIVDGKIRIEGEVHTYIIYLADDENGSVRSLNTCINFMENIELQNKNENMIANLKLKLKNIESKIINGRKINIKAFIEVETNIYENVNMEIVNNIGEIKDMQILKTNQQIISLLGKGDTRVNAKDTVSINELDTVAEIMKVDLKILDKEVKTSYNKILIKAEAEINILYLTEDNRINSINTRIPVMGFTDMQDINENCICNVNEFLNNIIIKPNNNDEHSIYIEAEIEFQIEAYETKKIDIVEDLYCISSNAEFSQKRANAMIGRENIKDECKIKENIEIPELDGKTICSTNIMPNIIKQDNRTNKIIYEGEVLVEILYAKNEKMEMKQINIPFNFEILSNSINSNSRIITDINVRNENFITSSNSSLDISMSLEFNVTIEENKEINLIEEINLEDKAEINPFSMVIYFVKPGDTLWKIAKQFKTRVEDITRVNEIENENNIHVGEQLYIPKYVSCNG